VAVSALNGSCRQALVSAAESTVAPTALSVRSDYVVLRQFCGLLDRKPGIEGAAFQTFVGYSGKGLHAESFSPQYVVLILRVRCGGSIARRYTPVHSTAICHRPFQASEVAQALRSQVLKLNEARPRSPLLSRCVLIT